ncbi:ABC transporter substrate-binding protein [Terriglobus aquaticus]|uniref:ABC transporter substrate-binding protein n=1 Tax=Terriglobus aquaticus TaxID=940139 RepID=A0ABW9KHJ0_9BACT|nr:extracellular solute-binding protein [Terriglobus aquaticus]
MAPRKHSTQSTPQLRAVACVCATVIGAAPTFAQHLTLTIATHYTDDQRAPLTPCLRAYERLHSGITIVHRQLSYRDLLQSLFLSRMGGQPPDIYNLSTTWTRQLVESNALAQPPASISSFVQQSYLPNTTSAITSDGRLWGIPSETDVYMLVYNKLLFAQNGITHPPSNTAEWISDAAKISRTNRQGQLVVSGFTVGSSQNQIVAPFLTLLFSGGQQLIAADGKSTNLTSAAAHSALQAEVDLFRSHGAEWGTVPYQFPSGAIGMMVVPNWFNRPLHQGFEQRFDQTVAVAPIPAGADWRTLQYGFFWSVDANSPHPAEAWALLQWLNTAQQPGGRSCVGNMLMALGGLTGNRQDLAASTAELNTPFLRPFVDALSSGRALPQPSIRHANEIEALTGKYLERAMLGVIPTDTALHQLDAGIRTILQEQE